MLNSDLCFLLFIANCSIVVITNGFVWLNFTPLSHLGEGGLRGIDAT